ncbi:hemolysin family protein [Thalassococcus sp. S3]|uniref:hemolysin family protein n=1 Tax=Thalassococcus sp. S3 TaxID=2017482 RepID=UPI0010249062|nr:hemolysin family protein [Thalassococcus sp. S3]QBF30733.1 magnesium/cobalt efflux protein [Thalassococcus sp. S3]
MGDTDGSSSAAHSAHSDEKNDTASVGFFSRIFGGRRVPEPEQGEDQEVAASAAPRTHGMMNLRVLRVEDVAIPKAEITAVPASITKNELVGVFRESGFTRLPVYENTLDTPIGFAHLKDFALSHGFNGKGADFDLARMVRPLLFVPPSMPIGVLLTKMQTERRHMALVIDEYGGVDGLLTIEDLVEQVVGEIEDEHDTDEDQTWVKEKPGCYVAQAKTPLAEFEAEIGRSLTAHDEVDEEEIDTLGGLVFMLSGRVPARGEVVPHPDGPEFEVIDADPRRIKRMRVRLPDLAV